MSTPRKIELRVLVVDDEADSRELLALALEREVVHVDVASSAREAFERILAAPPDVLMSDISMPGEDGWSLVQRLRALPSERGGAIPAFAVTALASVGDVARSHEAGFDLVLSKPLQPRAMTIAIHAAARLGPAATQLPAARRMRVLVATSDVLIASARNRDRSARKIVARGIRAAYDAERRIRASQARLLR